MSTDRGQQGRQEVEQHVDIEHRDIDDPASAWAPGTGGTETALPVGGDDGVETGMPAAPEGLYHEVHYGGALTSEAPLGAAPLAEYEPLEDEDWMAVRAPRGVRLRVPTLVLLALLVAAGAFWGGAVVQRHQGSTSSASSLASRLRAGGFAFGGGGTGAGTGGFGGATTVAPAAEGTVTDVQGPTVYLTNAAGDLVKVIIGATTTVSRTGIGAPGALQIGDTAIVRGTAGSDGTVAATSITATASGVSATAGTGSGLAGGPGFGGGAGAGG